MDAELLASKTDRVRAPHVSPLNDLVRAWRLQWPHRSMLWFDPDDGGIEARVLILMEAPGPRNIPADTHGFCTEDNADPTARSLAQERARAGLERADYVRWNIVPWLPVGTDGTWQSPRPSDLDEAMEPLTQVREFLPDLQLVITVGRPALHGWTRQQTVFHQDVVPLLAVPHQSQRNTRGREESLERWRYALSVAARMTTDPSVQ